MGGGVLILFGFVWIASALVGLLTTECELGDWLYSGFGVLLGVAQIAVGVWLGP